MNEELFKLAYDFIKKHEGEKLKAYKDVGGLWTIGIGHLITEYDKKNYNWQDLENLEISQEVCDNLFRLDLTACYDCLKKQELLDLSNSQKVALMSFIFNLGTSNFASSALLKVLKSKNFDSVKTELIK
ncbi:MAG: lysozyme [Alphaproteobacteria bacterium]|jgi:lysozyme|nr:lysozyme [Alphaproteobacteria bacterium]